MSDSRKDRPATPDDAAGSPGGGKGRPTPKRRVAQEANKRPLVPSDRRAAYRAERTRRKELRAKMNEAMITGDERYMPARDRGPIRRWVRQYVDARWNLGEFFLPASLAIIIVVFLAGERPQLAIAAILTIYLIVLAAVVDVIVMTRRVKKKILAKFGDVPRGTLMYASMRAFQIRRTRMPRPMTKKRGGYPD